MNTVKFEPADFPYILFGFFIGSVFSFYTSIREGGFLVVLGVITFIYNAWITFKYARRYFTSEH